MGDCVGDTIAAKLMGHIDYHTWWQPSNRFAVSVCQYPRNSDIPKEDVKVIECRTVVLLMTQKSDSGLYRTI